MVYQIYLKIVKLININEFTPEETQKFNKKIDVIIPSITKWLTYYIIHP